MRAPKILQQRRSRLNGVISHFDNFWILPSSLHCFSIMLLFCSHLDFAGKKGNFCRLIHEEYVLLDSLGQCSILSLLQVVYCVRFCFFVLLSVV